MNPTSPEVTIGIPVYNGANFLADALESAISQKDVDLEIIVVDNGSTDESLSIARRYAAADPRITVEATDADMPGVVMGTGIQAAGNLQIEFADVMQVIKIIKALLNLLGYRNRMTLSQSAEILTRAANHVRQHTGIGNRQTVFPGLDPKVVQSFNLHIRQDQVLVLTNSEFAQGELVSQIGHDTHDVRAGVTRSRAGVLQGQDHSAVSWHLMGEGVGF